MSRLDDRELSRRLRGGAPPEPPPGLLDALRRDIPEELPRLGGAPDNVLPFRSRPQVRRLLVAAASVVTLLGGGMVAWRVVQEAPELDRGERAEAVVAEEAADSVAGDGAGAPAAGARSKSAPPAAGAPGGEAGPAASLQAARPVPAPEAGAGAPPAEPEARMLAETTAAPPAEAAPAGAAGAEGDEEGGVASANAAPRGSGGERDAAGGAAAGAASARTERGGRESLRLEAAAEPQPQRSAPADVAAAAPPPPPPPPPPPAATAGPAEDEGAADRPLLDRRRDAAPAQEASPRRVEPAAPAPPAPPAAMRAPQARADGSRGADTASSIATFVRVDAVRSCNELAVTNPYARRAPGTVPTPPQRTPSRAGAEPFAGGTVHLRDVTCLGEGSEYRAAVLAALATVEGDLVFDGPPEAARLTALPVPGRREHGDVALLLVRAGLARPTADAPEAFHAAEREARQARRGWWSRRPDGGG